MSAIQKKVLLNEEMIAVNQDYQAPAGKRVGGWDCDAVGGSAVCQVWARFLTDGSVAVALYNADIFDSHDITLDYALLGPKFNGKSLYVRDLWEHQDLGLFSKNYTVSIKPTATVVVRVSEDQREPLKLPRD